MSQSAMTTPIHIRTASVVDVPAVARLMAAEAEELKIYDSTVEFDHGFDWAKFAEIQIRRPGSHLRLAESPDEVVGLMQTLLVATPSRRNMSRLPQRVIRGLLQRWVGNERDLVRRACHGRIEHIFVLPGHRRLHASVLLYRDGIRWLHEQEATFVEGIVHEHNLVIKSLAARWGFEPVRVMMRRSV